MLSEYLFIQLSLFRLENSMYVLVGQLSGHNAQCQLEAVRCLHELSNSPHRGVGQSCLSATPYLLTYLSSPSAKLTVSEGHSQNVWLFYMMHTICTSVFYVCVCMCVYVQHAYTGALPVHIRESVARGCSSKREATGPGDSSCSG